MEGLEEGRGEKEGKPKPGEGEKKIMKIQSIEFLEKMLKIASKPEDVEFLVNLLFELKTDLERGK